MDQSLRCLAEKKCQQRDRDFSWLFRNQYILSPDETRTYPGWNKQVLAGWVLHHGTALRNCPILDANGQKVGFLLGHALTPDSTIVEDSYTIPVSVSSDRFVDVVDRSLTGLAGRYLGIILTKGCERIYSDPVSDMPLLYDAKSRKVASSLGLVLDWAIQPNPRFPIRNVLSGKQTLSFQHSLDNEVKRGISNHFLDLTNFSLHRHWPDVGADFNTVHSDVSERIDQLVERLSAHLKALINHFDCILPLTGGRDSRILLSCALPVLDNVKELSGYRFHNPSRVDTRIARELLESMGYPYKQYFKKKASVTQLRDLRLKMGWSGARGEFAALAMIEEYPLDHLILRGNIMELLRANQWRKDTIGAPFRMTHGVRRLGVTVKTTSESTSKWAPHYMEWYNTLPECARSNPYDFAFLELLLPNTQGAFLNGIERNVMINPFNDRKLIELTIGMPISLRKDETIIRSILEQTNPFLLETRFH